jgi:hypothetical protein
MSRREEWMTGLSAAVANGDWDACPRLLYCVLYGAPADTQLLITINGIKRYLPIIEAHWPGVTWPRQILDAPDLWIRTYRRAIPEQPQADRDSDAAFVLCLDALLLAWSYQADPGILTSSCSCGIIEFIRAMRDEAAERKETARDVDEVRRSAWQHIFRQMTAANLQAYPDVPSLERLKTDLAEWEAHAMLLIVPDAAYSQ